MSTNLHDVPQSGADATSAPISTAGDVAAKQRSPIMLLLAVIALLVVALGAMTAMWANANSQLSALAAEQSAVPNLREVADRHFAGVTAVYGDADSVSITVLDYNVSEAAPALRDMLGELGFSSAVADRMAKTRALDGTQQATGRNCNVTWTYHPDNGLQMVFEATPPR